MPISKTAMVELDTSLSNLKSKVDEVRGNLKEALKNNDLKVLGSLQGDKFLLDVRGLAGLSSLKDMISSGGLRHASTGKLRLYKGILSKFTSTTAFIRLFREAIAEEYSNEWVDIIDPKEGYVLVNPNQRARYGVLLYSMTVEASPSMKRYLEYVRRKLNNSIQIEYHPVVVSMSERNAESFLPTGGFDVYSSQSRLPRFPLELDEVLLNRMLASISNVVRTMLEPHPRISVWSAEQLITEVKKEFLNPSFLLDGASLKDVMDGTSFKEVPQVSIASRYNRLFQLWFSDLSILSSIQRTPAPDRERLLNTLTLMKLVRGEIEYSIAYQVDVSAQEQFSRQGGKEFLAKVSSVIPLLGSLESGTPVSSIDSFRRLTGLNLEDWTVADGFRSRHTMVSQRLASYRPYTEEERSLRTCGTELGVGRESFSIKAMSRELSGPLSMFRTLMRKNIWLMKK